ncbi:MAG: hypothetical protein MUE91_14125 [Ignavibacteriaceae bacterium]|nr:hypothetical protein [Ignavibacteriaceae bacterium]
MNKISKIILIGLILCSVSSTKIFSQSIAETLSNLSSGAVLKYSEPVIDAFGSSMNSGWFTGLPSSSNGIHAKLRFVGVGSFFTDDLRRFSYVGNLRLTSPQVDEILISSGYDPGTIQNYESLKSEILSRDWEVKFDGPTITGNVEEYLLVEFPEVEVQGYTIESYTFELTDVKGYLDNIDVMPSPALQLDLGSVIGTAASVRYFRGINLRDLGIVNIWGGGIIHNLNYWFGDALPLEVGLGYYFQSFKVGDIFENTASQYGFFLSKRIGGRISIEPYAGLTETSRSEINYKYQFDSPAGRQELLLNIDYNGDQTVNLAVGTSVNLSIFVLNFDYKFGGTRTGTVGVGFGF